MDSDPDPGGPKTYGSDGSGSATLAQHILTWREMTRMLTRAGKMPPSAWPAIIPPDESRTPVAIPVNCHQNLTVAIHYDYYGLRCQWTLLKVSRMISFCQVSSWSFSKNSLKICKIFQRLKIKKCLFWAWKHLFRSVPYWNSGPLILKHNQKSRLWQVWQIFSRDLLK